MDMLEVLKLMDIPRLDKLDNMRIEFEKQMIAAKLNYDSFVELNKDDPGVAQTEPAFLSLTKTKTKLLKKCYEHCAFLYCWALQEYNLVNNE